LTPRTAKFRLERQTTEYEHGSLGSQAERVTGIVTDRRNLNPVMRAQEADRTDEAFTTR
jgi:hypothetical protein